MHHLTFCCLFLSLVRRMWKSTFVPETIFRRSIRLRQTGTTCWKIQTYSDELNWARRRIFHELKSQTLVRLMKSSTFGQGLRYYGGPKRKRKQSLCKSCLFSVGFRGIFFILINLFISLCDKAVLLYPVKMYFAVCSGGRAMLEVKF